MKSIRRLLLCAFLGFTEGFVLGYFFGAIGILASIFTGFLTAELIYRLDEEYL